MKNFIWIIAGLIVVVLLVVLLRKKPNMPSGQASQKLSGDAIPYGTYSPRIVELQQAINLAASKVINNIQPVAVNGVLSESVVNELAKIYPQDEAQAIRRVAAITQRQIDFYLEAIQDEL